MWVGTALVTLVALLTGCQRPDERDAFVGVWIARAGGTPFFTLTVSNRDGTATAALASPAWNTSDGISFTVTSPTTSRRDTTAVRTGSRGQLVLVFGGATAASEADTLELSLLDADHAQLLYVGLPFEPWVMTRSRGMDETPISWNVGSTYTLDASSESPNPEMASIYDADQEGRASAKPGADWIQVERDDVVRRRRTRALLEAGQIKAGIDFERAAVVFQHGGTPDDHLLAHTLALVALAKRQTSARWIATASLDAYLQAVGQPQIFGTRFTGEGDSSKVSEPFNRGLVSDDLRRALNVPALADQEAQFRAAIRR